MARIIGKAGGEGHGSDGRGRIGGAWKGRARHGRHGRQGRQGRDRLGPSRTGKAGRERRGAARRGAAGPGRRLTKNNESGDRVPIYGVPQILLSPVRSADMNRTPDIRTRAIIRHWACTFEIAFVMPLLKQQSIANLLASAGLTQGIGDWRPQKGAGSYGQFSLVNADDPRYLKVIAEGGRAAQLAAMAAPEAFDQESEDLLSWFAQQKEVRGWNGTAKPSKPPGESRA